MPTPQHQNRRQRFPPARPDATPLRDDIVAAALVRSAHRPLLLREVLRVLSPRAGDVVVDATLGGGGHAQALLGHGQPGGRLIGLDVDRHELARATARLRADGFGVGELVTRHGSFADLPAVMAGLGVAHADLVLADLGVSAMQLDDPSRGFHYKAVGPLDLRLDPASGVETAADLIARLDAGALAHLLEAYADEPHAPLVARLLQAHRVTTIHALERVVRTGLTSAHPGLTNAAVKLSVRRTVQALRIAVNDELTALERLLAALPDVLAPGGRVAILTFHSGEDRRVKKAFQAGHRAGIYAAIAREAIRSTKAETFADRRAVSAKLRWAIRSARG